MGILHIILTFIQLVYSIYRSSRLLELQFKISSENRLKFCTKNLLKINLGDQDAVLEEGRVREVNTVLGRARGRGPGRGGRSRTGGGAARGRGPIDPQRVAQGRGQR